MINVNDINNVNTAPAAKEIPFYKKLYVQVLIAIFAGVLLGYFDPELGVSMKPLGDAFIKLIKMIVGPIIFCTLVTGVASMDNIGQAGKVALKAMIYFAILSAISLAIGMVVTNVVEPGVGMNVDAKSLDTQGVKDYIGEKAHADSLSKFLMDIIPNTIVDAFAKGEVIQVLFFAVLFACAVVAMGPRAKPVVKFIDDISHILFVIIAFIMKVAPLGAFGAMAFTVGKFGVASLIPLSKLVICFYLTCIAFVFIFLGGIMAYIRFNIFKFLAYIKEEIFIVFGTSSSETVLPRMLDKLTALGCKRSVVGMVLPTGYSFNLDGSAMYLSMAAIFLAQATNTPMTLTQQITMLAIMMLTSKGAAGVVGTAFIALAATLSTVGHIPVESIALILGIDRFMSTGRAVTNLIGNGVATVLMAKLENSLDVKKAHRILNGEIEPELETDVEHEDALKNEINNV